MRKVAGISWAFTLCVCPAACELELAHIPMEGHPPFVLRQNL